MCKTLHVMQIVYLIRHGRAYHNGMSERGEDKWRFLDDHLKLQCALLHRHGGRLRCWYTRIWAVLMCA
jgi:broad specificity phosphatase PhoE